MVKIPSMIALDFWMALARRAAVAGAIVIAAGSRGDHRRWRGGTASAAGSAPAGSTPSAPRRGAQLDVTADRGRRVTGFGGVLLGLGDHTTAVLSLTRPSPPHAALVTLRMLIAVLTGRLHAVGALGVSLGTLVLLFPVVQPWYLLWGVIPLAAWATTPAFRIPTIVASPRPEWSA